VNKIAVSKIAVLLCLFLIAAGAFGSCKSVTTTENTTLLTTGTGSTTIINSTPSQIQEMAVSRDQALALASQFVPSSVILQADISVTLGTSLSPNDVWSVMFYGLQVTRDELLAFGWSDSELSGLGSLPTTGFIDIGIDSETGAVLYTTFVGALLPPPSAVS